MKYIVIIILSFFALTAKSQVELADYLFDNYEYKLAIKYYESCELLRQDEAKRLGLAYYYVNDFKNAERIFEQIADAKQLKYSDSLIYAECLKNIKAFDEALTFLPKAGKTELDKEFIKDFKKEVKFLKDYYKKEREVEVSLFDLTKINSGAADLYAKPFKKGILYISEEPQKGDKLKLKELDTLAQKEELAYGSVLRPKASLFYYSSKDGKNKISMPEDFHVGAFDIDYKNNLIYLTRTDYFKKWHKYKSEQLPHIWVGFLDIENLRVENLKPLKFEGIKPKYPTGHPCILPDTNIIYFATAIEGGHGGFDIYSGYLNKGKVDSVKNLGPNVNTEGDEFFPTIADSNILYFASDGHPGFGNLDLFKTEVVNYHFPKKAEILPEPFNSPADDFCFVYSRNKKTKGYITSNRAGGIGDDDLYLFKMGKQLVTGVARDQDGNILVGALVQLFDLDGNLIAETYTDEQGRYAFKVTPGEYELLITTEDGFIARQRIVVDENWDNNKDINLQLVENTESVELTSTVMDRITGEYLQDVTIETYKKNEAGEWELQDTQVTDESAVWNVNIQRNLDQKVVFKHNKYETHTVEIFSKDVDRASKINEMLMGIELNVATMSGVVVDAITNKPVENAVIELYEKQEDGSYKLVATVLTDKDGKWTHSIDNTKDYKIKVKREGYDDYSFRVPSVYSMSEEKRDKYLAKMGKMELSPSADLDAKINIDNIYFEFGKSDIQEDSYEILDNIYKFLRRNRTIVVELSAHTDCIGSDSQNMKLSKKRAQSCYEYLIDKGIDKSRMVPKGYGKTQMLNDCDLQKRDPKAAAINRRVELKVLKRTPTF